ncbi:MAG: serine/threonine protein kinase [Leptolyngbya sp. PLA1]|nr:serine/threonine protein kinase [Leptolyngbya sp. PLA1]
MSQTETVTLTRAATKPTAADDAGGPPAPAVTIPARLGPVQLLREIGKGGMGTVWLGRHEMLHRDVAVKFMLNMVQSQDDPGFATFLEGARAAAAIRHKGINSVLNADVVEGIPFLVMEYVDGPTLDRLLELGGKFTPAVVRVVLEAACEAVGELHDQGIIHRDIKPSNILIQPDGTPVLTDFGLACARPAQSMGERVEGVAGTPCYMAPEMFDRMVSARSDVYALGVMAFELLTGHLPFEGSLDEVRRAQRETEPNLAEITGIHPALEELLTRAMNKNPMFRLKSARHMRHAVEEAFGQIDQMLVARAKGEAELAALLATWSRGGRAASGGAEPTPEPSSYYDRLTTLVSKRKNDSDPAHSADVDQLIERVPQGVACARCATHIGGEPVTGRCPGCLLLVRLTLKPDQSPGASTRPAAPAPPPTAESAPASQSPAGPGQPSPRQSGLFTRLGRAWRGFWHQ